MPERKYIEYEITDESEKENKGRLTLGFMLGECDEREKILAFSIITDAICDSNDAPLKKVIIDSGLCEDVYASVRDGVLEPALVFDFINVKDGKEGELLSLFRDTVSGIIEQGIDKEELSATLNVMEFKVRERDYGTLPIGVLNAMVSLETLLYSDDPVGHLRYEDMLAELCERINDGSGYYEGLLREFIIDNQKCATVIMHPSLTLAEKRLAKEKAQLAEYKASLDECGIV
jgi:Zn-dependent M16 (insulinase) family peptidase